jgi:predicted lipoprotein with Yx(FWY)xxD motif
MQLSYITGVNDVERTTSHSEKPTKLLQISLFISIAISGCGSDSSDPITTPIPETPTVPTVPTFEFPVQTSGPELFVAAESGSILTSTAGLSLYTFDNDQACTSNCNGVDGDTAGSTTDESSCAGQWPPLLVGDGGAAQGNFSLVTRADGTQQWAYEDIPLYTFGGDNAQGDISGDGVGSVWHLARPKAFKTANINEVSTYVGNQTILSVISTGEVLESFRADKDGFALYIFDADLLNESACYGLNGDSCITAWPPLLADTGAKPTSAMSVLDLANGQQQWAYKGKALYFFAGDTAAGDSNGANIGNVWHLANKLPAIQRVVDDISRLSSTGEVSVLLPNVDNNNALEVSQNDKDQFTLYTFDNDEAGISNCNDGCAVAWPPFIASEDETASGAFSKTARTDGNMQWAYNDKPLYFFGSDAEKGDMNGDGVGGVWHIIQPAAEPVVSQITTSISSLATDLGQSFTVDGDVNILVTDANGDSQVTVVDKTDFQLYTFDNDAVQTSNCTSEGCKQAWPALIASDSDIAAAPFSLFEREDGHMQWAINGQPLYFFSSDTDSAQTNGEGIGDVWWVARPAPLRVFEHDTKGSMLVANDLVLASQGKSVEQLNDLTVYTFDDDTANSGVSKCSGGCAVTWPPLYASSADQAFGDYQIINRTESDDTATLQWSYKGLPLYFFISDSVLGDTGGDYPTWEIARP